MPVTGGLISPSSLSVPSKGTLRDLWVNRLLGLAIFHIGNGEEQESAQIIAVKSEWSFSLRTQVV